MLRFFPFIVFLTAGLEAFSQTNGHHLQDRAKATLKVIHDAARLGVISTVSTGSSKNREFNGDRCPQCLLEATRTALRCTTLTLRVCMCAVDLLLSTVVLFPHKCWLCSPCELPLGFKSGTKSKCSSSTCKTHGTEKGFLSDVHDARVKRLMRKPILTKRQCVLLCLCPDLADSVVFCRVTDRSILDMAFLWIRTENSTKSTTNISSVRVFRTGHSSSLMHSLCSISVCVVSLCCPFQVSFPGCLTSDLTVTHC